MTAVATAAAKAARTRFSRRSTWTGCCGSSRPPPANGQALTRSGRVASWVRTTYSRECRTPRRNAPARRPGHTARDRGAAPRPPRWPARWGRPIARAPARCRRPQSTLGAPDRPALDPLSPHRGGDCRQAASQSIEGFDLDARAEAQWGHQRAHRAERCVEVLDEPMHDDAVTESVGLGGKVGADARPKTCSRASGRRVSNSGMPLRRNQVNPSWLCGIDSRPTKAKSAAPFQRAGVCAETCTSGETRVTLAVDASRGWVTSCSLSNRQTSASSAARTSLRATRLLRSAAASDASSEQQ